MAQWFKFKKATPVVAEYNYNLGELRSKLDALSPKIYDGRFTPVFKSMKQALELAKNIRILNIAKFKAGEGVDKLYKHQGAIEAYDEILALFDKMLMDEELKQKSTSEKGARKYVKNQSAAGAADW